jgi:hypothetical protein
MHRALQILEVVEEICSHVVPNQPGRHTLASLARTATLFQDPALNILWRWQGTFAHILRCMPEDLWNVPVREGSVNILVSVQGG